MMKAVFKKKYFWNIVCLLCGLFLIGFFVFIRIVDSEATSAGYYDVILGGVICTFSILFLLHNFKAYLLIDGRHITGRYNWFRKFDFDISEVAYAQFVDKTLTILLKDGKQHLLTGIENAFAICFTLRRIMPFEPFKDIRQAMGELEQMKAMRRKRIMRLILCIVFMFLYIFITTALTGFRELDEFGHVDWVFFFLMVVMELVTMVVMFYYAGRVGKGNMPIERQKYGIRRSIVETSPLLPGYVKGVYTDENYTGRLTLLGYQNNESVYYVVQEFDSNYRLETVHKSETYQSADDIPNGLDSLVDITETVLS